MQDILIPPHSVRIKSCWYCQQLLRVFSGLAHDQTHPFTAKRYSHYVRPQGQINKWRSKISPYYIKTRVNEGGVSIYLNTCYVSILYPTSWINPTYMKYKPTRKRKDKHLLFSHIHRDIRSQSIINKGNKTKMYQIRSKNSGSK